MDKMEDSGSFDYGSIPYEGTIIKKNPTLKWDFLLKTIFLSFILLKSAQELEHFS